MLCIARLAIPALCAAVLLSGCVTTTDQVMKSQVGESIDRVIEQWGAPDTVAELSDGRRVLTWQSIYGGQGGVSTCRQSFTAGPTGAIEHWSHSGCLPIVWSPF